MRTSILMLAALVASACGAAIAGLAFFAAGSLDQFGVAAVSFLPPLGLSLRELAWLALVPAASMASLGLPGITVDRVLPLADAPEAHRLLASRRTIGKLLLQP